MRDERRYYTFQEIALIATYEELFRVSESQRVTEYFLDYGMHVIKKNALMEDVQRTYEKALKSIGVTEEEFERDDQYLFRGEIANVMCQKNGIPVPEYLTPGRKGAYLTDDDIREIAYKRYKSYWMLTHGFTVEDIFKLQREYEANPDVNMQSFEAYLEKTGFDGQIWSCKNEFLNCEYWDKEFMERILSPAEYNCWASDIEHRKVKIKKGERKNLRYVSELTDSEQQRVLERLVLWLQLAGYEPWEVKAFEIAVNAMSCTISDLSDIIEVE